VSGGNLGIIFEKNSSPHSGYLLLFTHQRSKARVVLNPQGKAVMQKKDYSSVFFEKVEVEPKINLLWEEALSFIRLLLVAAVLQAKERR